MNLFLEYYPLLVPLAPLLSAVWSILPRRRMGDETYRLGLVAHALALAVAVVTLGQTVYAGDATWNLAICETPWSFLPTIELSVDRLSAVMMVVIAGIGLVLYRFSIRYLQSELGQPRFLSMLSFTISTLLVMVSSRDLIVLFLAWQLLSWLLCLLSYNFSHALTARSSFRTFIMLRLGDIAFLAGIVLAFQLYGTVEFAPLFERAATPITLHPLGGFEIGGATAVTLLIFVGAMSKSAQVPFHMWLPDSLYAPTPIHGLLHAGIINAGGFLLTRLAPLYILSPATLHIVFFVGLVTAILGTSMRLVQNDIKKSLGYSTIGQMGYMVMECGVGAFSLAIFHLIAHGLFKASVFLNCGNVIHETREEPRHPHPASEIKLGAIDWTIGFFLSLALPLAIVFGAHKLLNPHDESQGMVIFLLFIWVTASQTMLTIYRRHGIRSWKPQSILLVVVTVTTLAFLYASERFASFLYPSHDTVKTYLNASAIPNGLFLTILGIAVVAIVAGWVFAFKRRVGRILTWPKPINDLQTSTYLLFVNRFYLDGVAIRWRLFMKRLLESLSDNQFFFPGAALLAIVIAASRTESLADVSPVSVIGLVLAGLLLPLFPLHSAYITALTKAPRGWGLVLSVVMPLAGLFILMLISDIPVGLRPIVSTLALVGAIYATVKAVVQKSVPLLTAKTGVALYSILWWQISTVGKVTHEALMYASAVALVIVGIRVAWDRLQVRYGDLPMDRFGGLAQTMPRFGLCLALLIMAGVGLPPFGLVFSFLGLLLSAPALTTETLIVLLTWFGVSWYLFKLMQRLLFGPARQDLRYDDLKPMEIAAFAAVLLLLILLSAVPEVSLDTVQELAPIATEMEWIW